jgi:hypothetical protein
MQSGMGDVSLVHQVLPGNRLFSFHAIQISFGFCLLFMLIFVFIFFDSVVSCASDAAI